MNLSVSIVVVVVVVDIACLKQISRINLFVLKCLCLVCFICGLFNFHVEFFHSSIFAIWILLKVTTRIRFNVFLLQGSLQSYFLLFLFSSFYLNFFKKFDFQDYINLLSINWKRLRNFGQVIDEECHWRFNYSIAYNRNLG